jgi:hypothetical protein
VQCEGRTIKPEGPARGKKPKSILGADRLVVAKKAGNSARAKGSAPTGEEI